MIRKAIALALVTALLQVSGAGVRIAADELQSMDQTKAEVAKAHAKQYNVVVKSADKKLRGKVVALTDDSFTVRDQTGTDTSFSYSNLEVSRHRRLGTKILIGIGLAAGVAAAVVIASTLRGADPV